MFPDFVSQNEQCVYVRVQLYTEGQLVFGVALGLTSAGKTAGLWAHQLNWQGKSDSPATSNTNRENNYMLTQHKVQASPSDTAM